MLRNIWNQISGVWSGMTTGQRATVSIVAVTLFVTLSVVGLVASRTQYRLLHANLDEKDAAEIMTKLQEWEVPFKMGNGGRSILVAAGNVAELKVRLRGAGAAPGGEIGYAELFDTGKGFGRTDREMTIADTRALQGEVTRMLKLQPYLKSASVMLARPKPTLFVTERKPVTASVVVYPKNDRLTEDQVYGIANIVAGAVPDLDPEQVTIVDHRGRTLTSSGRSKQFGAGNQLDVQRDLEETLALRALSQLFVLVGPDNASVQVTARLDFKRKAETVETVDGEQKPTREKVSSTNRTGGGPGGLASVSATLADANEVPAQRGMTETTEDVETDYLYGRTTTTTESNGGKIERLTVSVVASRSASELLAGTADGGTSEDKLTSAKAAIESIVRDAVGFEEGRDTITVAFSDQFDVIDEVAEPAGALDRIDIDKLLPIIETVGALLVVVVIFFLVRPVLKRSVASVVPGAPAMVGAGEGMAQLAAPGMEGGEAEAMLAAPQLSPTAQLGELVENDPEKVAKIMKNWVAKEEV